MSTYDQPPENYGEMMAPYPSKVKELADNVRKLIGEVFPDAEENISGGKSVALTLYSIEGPTDVYCGIMPHKKHIKLFVHHWKGIHHPEIKLEGKGKHARHLKVFPEDNNLETIRWLLATVRKEGKDKSDEEHV